jgi:uncharacterized damage-inducible protein DinB
MTSDMTDEPEFPPATNRRDPPFQADERTMLDAWLDFHRATLLTKCEGLSDEQLRMQSVPPSPLTLIGLVRHMTEVERGWFRYVLAGEDPGWLYSSEKNPEGDLFDVADADVTSAFRAFDDEVVYCRELTSRYDDLDAVGAQQRHGRDVSLRWIYVHMIEEYARHNGHADFLRERIDGVTGD